MADDDMDGWYTMDDLSEEYEAGYRNGKEEASEEIQRLREQVARLENMVVRTADLLDRWRGKSERIAMVDVTAMRVRASLLRGSVDRTNPGDTP